MDGWNILETNHVFTWESSRVQTNLYCSFEPAAVKINSYLLLDINVIMQLEKVIIVFQIQLTQGGVQFDYVTDSENRSALQAPDSSLPNYVEQQTAQLTVRRVASLINVKVNRTYRMDWDSRKLLGNIRAEV